MRPLCPCRLLAPADVSSSPSKIQMNLSRDSFDAGLKKKEGKSEKDGMEMVEATMFDSTPARRRNPVGTLELNEGVVDIDGAVGESRRKKTARFQEPADNVPDEIETYTPRGEIEDDITYITEDRNWKKDIIGTDLLCEKSTEEQDENLKPSVFDYTKTSGLHTVSHSSQQKAIARGFDLLTSATNPLEGNSPPRRS
ncbi:unnamed protein product [Calypogeia fissa]